MHLKLNFKVIVCKELYFREQRRFLLITSKAAKPSEADLEVLLKPTAAIIADIQNFR
jgi:hypothetical protein